MNKMQLSGIFLGIVMLCGVTPLGFSEPLRVQLEQGIETEKIQCDNPNHVLVLRTNGKLACVTEKSAMKTGWEIISDSIQKIVYDYPLSSNGNQSENNDDVSSVGYIWSSHVEITISNLPKIGETADVTVKYTNLDNTETLDFMKKTLTTYKNLEIVSINGQTDNLPEYINEPLKILAPNETETINLVVRAVEEGKSKIKAYFDEESADASISMFIGEEQTLLLEDYEKLHPSQNSPRPPGLGPDEIWDPDMETIEVPVDDGDTPDPFEGMTQAEIREALEQMGYEGTELEEFAKEIYEELNPDLETQSFFDSIIPKAFASSHTIFSLRGNIFNSVSDYDTTGKTTVYGVRVCAVDKNLSTGSFAFLKNTSNKIACTNTTEFGTYALRNIVNNDPNDNTNADLYMYFSTNGNYVDIKKETNNRYAATYKVGDNYLGTGTLRENYNLSGYDQFHRAVWILDTLHDAREFFDDENMRIKSVDVIWQYNKDLEDVTGVPSTCNANACYDRTTNTIWLGGTDPNESSSFGNEHKIWTQLHEYGHHVMRNNYGDGNNWGSCDGGSHSLTRTNSETCAWSEGWADFVPHLVTNDSKIQRSTSSWIDLEKDGISRSASITDNPYRPFPTEIGRPTYDVGHLSEGQVASMLWDIKDNVQDSIHDKRYGSPKDNINVSRNANDNILSAFGGVKDIVNDFYLQWNTENTSTPLNSIADLHHIVVNELPTANPQTVNVSPTDTTTITLTGSDPENEKLRFQIISPSSFSKGTLTDLSGKRLGSNDILTNRDNTSALVKYTPKSGATGTDSFTFRVKDTSYDSPVVTVTINITQPANTPPVATPKSTITVNEDSSTTFYLRGTDANNDNLTFTITNSPDDGTLTKEIGSFGGNSQQYKYTPDLSFSGTDEFWFKVNDGTDDSQASNQSLN